MRRPRARIHARPRRGPAAFTVIRAVPIGPVALLRPYFETFTTKYTNGFVTVGIQCGTPGGMTTTSPLVI